MEPAPQPKAKPKQKQKQKQKYQFENCSEKFRAGGKIMGQSRSSSERRSASRADSPPPFPLSIAVAFVAHGSVSGLHRSAADAHASESAL
jgi:hypothetical protein